MKFKIPVALLTIGMAFGCGDDDDDKRGTITIGSVFPQTGAANGFFANFSGSLSLGRDKVNANGGVLGRTLAIDLRDEAFIDGDTTAAANAITGLIDSGVQAIIGPAISSTAIATAPLTGAAKVVHFTPVSGSIALETVDDDDYNFRLIPTSTQPSALAADDLYERGARTAAVMTINGALAQEAGQVFADRWQTLNGATLATNHVYEFTELATFDPAAELDAVFATNPNIDAIFLYGNPEDGGALLSAWDKSSRPVTWALGSNLSNEALAQTVGASKMEGIRVFANALPSGQAYEEFLIEYEAFNGFALDDLSPGVSVLIIDAFYLTILAIEQAGSYDGTAIRDELRSVANAPGTVYDATSFPAALAAVRNGEEINYNGLRSEIELDDVIGQTQVPINILEFTASGSLSVLEVITPE